MSIWTNPAVIVPCGAAKRDVRCRADEMYTGPYHRACLDYARTRTSDNRIFILSAMHGFLPLRYMIEPYDRHMKENGSDFWDDIVHQAKLLGIYGTPVVLLGGQLYTETLETIWKSRQWPIETPLKGLGGMGKQIQWLRQHSIK